ncbi:DUF7504 family protein [Haloglomus litoreum]|uniref:DUF7504 family protein n=1 Tax=Haloglomus litoreum TaxID=3034026 RepID=UPI0023E8A59B|nr:hypothetical protein [Haloglomus sp. DT116]
MTSVGSADAGLGKDPATAPPFEETPPANLLLLGPSMEDDGDAIVRLLESVTGTPALLAVSLLRPPAERIATWEERWRAPPAEVAAIGCTHAGTTPGESSTETPFRTTTVADPGDLTGLGIRINECLDAWSNRDPVVVFDSVTTMLQYADTRQVFQFCHVLTSRMKRAGVMSVFYMDPEAHDEQTVSTIRSLFEGVYEWTEDGWEGV